MSNNKKSEFVGISASYVSESFLKLNKEGQKLLSGYLNYLVSSKDYLRNNKNIITENDIGNIINDFDIKEETDIIESFIISDKKGRGRPRKIKSDEEKIDKNTKPTKVIEEVIIEKQPQKRGRGRPRKIIPENTVVKQKADVSSSIITSSLKRRGRPRKNTIIIESPEKRKRGRPRKLK
jgi:hypothetical protein